MNNKRIEKLINDLNNNNKEWDAAFVFDKINQYYFTGTMQDGVLVITPKNDWGYFVRKSFSRAVLECGTEKVYPMSRYSDISDVLGGNFHNIYIEKNRVTFSIIERMQKYFPIKNILPLDLILSKMRSVKDDNELNIIRKSAELHTKLMNETIPEILQEGMSEVDFLGRLYDEMLKLGYHGVSRFAMFQNETVIGQLGFGTNSIYPTCFDGPGGMKGLSPAVPIIGDRNRYLKKGDLIFVDVGFGFNGYHTDKTQIYSFGIPQSDYVTETHQKCIDIQTKTASLLKIGNRPCDIYNEIMSTIEPKFLNNFMGIGNDSVKFLGHGVGLQIDEYPVIAKGFNEPLELGTVIAIEPKKCIENIGIVGVEDTYLVTENGGECLTGSGREIILVN